MRSQFDSDHHQNRRLSSHSYFHEAVIFFKIFVKLRRVCVFSIKMHAATLLQPLKTTLRVSSLYYEGDSKLCTVASATGLRDAESIIFNRGRSVASWTFTGMVFHPAQRPVGRAPA